MRIPRIYIDKPITANSNLELDGPTAHYLLKVLRMESGRELILFNGQGGEYNAIIESAGKKSLTCTVADHTPKECESTLNTELAIGVSRGERMDWVLQKATELGVSRIVPLFAERTEVKLKGERLDKKVQHWQQILISACEQCTRNTLPVLATPTTLEQYVKTSQAEQKFVLHHRTEKQLRDITKPQSAALLIGPEGGLTEEEIKIAEAHGFNPLALGPRVLRTETAPIAALSVLQFVWGDF
ncbi:16S rRNA (uracil(1498)-N(3))-methyltransferase [Saccharophagus degradans]|uniref:Ribosomal RNA small subunit methyltransferase E n=1 Tax=Saccharophagus degradans TaxID=86304 RepID=A0AAW7X510_9GAMM|nr:16S rRNA (uracil(1498)-N(3))-methyltransferase [Saccharophagus degradans]MDO6422033.1 16S rRNA (uracil(1498)-N(3))-methyltransferase [Saccharophagus degradans]MDO6609768.1 16S rRNA (uracil(1498)-N(3))-methyltransferase [Saccharophagus degradans]